MESRGPTAPLRPATADSGATRLATDVLVVDGEGEEALEFAWGGDPSPAAPGRPKERSMSPITHEFVDTPPEVPKQRAMSTSRRDFRPPSEWTEAVRATVGHGHPGYHDYMEGPAPGWGPRPQTTSNVRQGMLSGGSKLVWFA